MRMFCSAASWGLEADTHGLPRSTYAALLKDAGCSRQCRTNGRPVRMPDDQDREAQYAPEVDWHDRWRLAMRTCGATAAVGRKPDVSRRIQHFLPTRKHAGDDTARTFTCALRNAARS
jgi:hypothetical protein